MKRKGTTAIAILCGCVCSLCVLGYTGSVRSEASAARTEALARYGGDQLEVCVATRDIAPGESVSASNVATRSWLVDLLPAEAVESMAEVSGKQASTPIVAGSVLSSKHFEGTAQSIVVPSGLQAVSVDVTPSQAVGGSLEAGMRVDVYAAGAHGASRIAPEALVTAVAGGVGAQSTVTLAVPPEIVEQVIAATQTASVYLTLPSQDEGNDDV